MDIINCNIGSQVIRYSAPLLIVSCLLLVIVNCAGYDDAIGGNEYVEWRIDRGDKGANQYSVLDQINKSNVGNLEVAWTYSTGDTLGLAMQVTPIVIHGVMYFTSHSKHLIAVDPANGEEKWVFDPMDGSGVIPWGTNRGVTYWEDEDGGSGRIFFTADERIFSVDAETGERVTTFGDNGEVSLRIGLGRDILGTRVHATSPGIIYEDLLIMGSAVGEAPGTAPGHVRAYNVRTGEIEWIFHTIPQPGEYGHDTWEGDSWKTAGGANVWGGFSLDEERGIVFLSTASPNYAWYGGDRRGDNLFGNSVIAVDAANGERLWHFQTVRHDIWDYDLPAPANLVTLERDGERVDAVAQVGKTGYVYVFERETGEPLFPIEDVPVPQSDVPGEYTSPTQPIPVKPPPFSRTGITEEDLTNLSEEKHARALEEFRKYRRGDGSPFVPSSLEGTIVMPFYSGGANWGGASFDPTTGILYVNSSDIPWIIRLAPNPAAEDGDGEHVATITGEQIYQQYCSMCHGRNLQGSPPAIPSLVEAELKESFERSESASVISRGSGQMPPFSGDLTTEEVDAVVAFLYGDEENAVIERTRTYPQPDFVLDGLPRFLDDEGYPAVKPPWGRLTAINLNTGEFEWQVPLGEFPELTERGHPDVGTEMYSGTIVTAGGLVFVGATQDEKFRAFDKDTGEILWETDLPAGGYAIPATYKIDGKQYVVIAAGGGGKTAQLSSIRNIGVRKSDVLIAFALP